ncbi:hypothetical protein AVS7_03231 [Acidovorax sp. MR-S7]|nr:hypothetical protein AVS7_03231 [Acidovorax sp. MR-S7]
MQKLLYVVRTGDYGVCDEMDGSSYPNFTIPAHEGMKTTEKKTVEVKLPAKTPGIVADVAITALLAVAPWSVALAAAAARPALAQLLASDPQKSAAPELLAKGEQEFASFVGENGITVATAKKRGYTFPPGHPQVGGTYMLHPLAELPAANKGAVYIPAEMFDDVLLQERESELLKLLVELGASRICITERVADANRRESVASVSGGAKAVAAQVDASAHLRTSKDYELGNERSYVLAGKAWPQGTQLDSSKFAWVHFEPSWGALVYAREIGGCLSATLEITEKTTFSLDGGLAAAVKTRLYSADAKFGHVEQRTRSRTFVVEAEFVPWGPPVSRSA